MPRRRHPRTLTPAMIRDRKKGLRKVLDPYYKKEADLNRAVNGFSANGVSAEKAEARIDRMKIAGVPLTGLQWKVGSSQARFDALIFRYEQLQGLTKAQATLVSNLFRKKVSQEVILRLVKTRSGRGKRYTWPKIKAKIDYLESIKLDPKIYGISKLRISDYEHVLHWTLQKIKVGSKRQVLMSLENKFMSEKLDEVLPGWRTSKRLMEGRLRPGTILARFKAAKRMRLKPTFYLLRQFSEKTILAGNARTSKLRQRKKVKAA